MSLPPIVPRRVVVTGLGVVTPIGSTKSAFWDSLVNGRGGIGRITRIDASQFPAQIAGEVQDFDPSDYFNRKDARHMDPYCQFAVASGIQAVNDSGLNFDNIDPERAGVILGSGIGGLHSYETQHEIFLKRGPKKISPFFIPMLIADIAAGHLSIQYNLQGPNYATTSACATSAHAIGCAMKAIRYNDADIIIAGGGEAPITDMGLGGFCSIKALSTNNDNPETACRPFDLHRDGFIMSEGAGAVILEDLDHAINRGATIYGEIAGVGFTGDAFHITAPRESGSGAARAMKIAINDALILPEEIDYINAHGTSTQLNDQGETRAIKTTFGEHAHNLAISSTKSMHGHLLGAAGAVEVIASLLAMQNNIVPPTINYETEDPNCDLTYTPNKAVSREINAVISNNFGFGGHNASLVIKRYQ